MKKSRALDRIALHLRMRANFAKTKAFFQWKELISANFTHSSGGEHAREDIGSLFSNLGITQLSKIYDQGSKLTKLQKKAIRKMDEATLTKLSAFFTQWKLKTLLLRGTKKAKIAESPDTYKVTEDEPFTPGLELEEKMRQVFAGTRSVKVKRLPEQAADDNCSNEE